MNRSGRGVAAAGRKMRAAEVRIARQAALVARYEAAGDEEEAAHARELLALLQIGLMLARLWAALEPASPSDDPSRRIH